jgi:methylmalonyl-CoA mutase
VNQSSPIAADFPEPSREAWLGLVEKTLKGVPFDKLTSRTADGLAIEPLYTVETSATPEPNAVRPPLRPDERPWDVRTPVDHPSPAQANADALRDLQNGAASVLLTLDPSGERGIAVGSADDLARVLDGVLLDLAPVALDAGFMGPQAADWLAAAAKGGPASPLAFHLDPLSAFAEAGESPGPIAAHVTAAAETGARHVETYPEAGLFLASGRVVHEAGGTEAQELGFMTAAALVYAKALAEVGLPLEEAFGRIVLSLAADGEYFITIAKLRAARVLWGKLTAACGVSAPARIEARSSRRMLSRLDPWVNMIRLTAAGFAAAVGGADAIVLDPFTQPLGRATAFARRQTRNTQLVLMEEAHLGRVADPAGGAWFLESLTDQMARAGWAFFQEIERRGGAVAALEGGFVAQAVSDARQARATAVARRKAGLIGVSEFANLAEPGVDVEQVDAAAFAQAALNVRRPGPDSRCAPLNPWRAAEPFERLRGAAQAITPHPRAFLATLGSAADHAARVGVIRNLLAAGGIAAETGVASDYDPAQTSAAVICGSDQAYAEEAEAAARALKAAGARHIYLAGRPADLEPRLSEAGVDGFLFAGMDVVAGLDGLLEAYR